MRSKRRQKSSEPSCLSIKSDKSKEFGITFQGENPAEEGVTSKRRQKSPGPSCLSIKSDQSKDFGITFHGENPADGGMRSKRRQKSPGPSCLSTKSDQSKGSGLNFQGENPADGRIKRKRSGSSGPSCVSLQSDQSKEFGINFEAGRPADGRIKRKRSESTGPSCLSMQSDQSKEFGINFEAGRPADESVQQSPEVLCDQSDQLHQTDLDSIFEALEEDIVTFAKKELKRVRRVLSPNDPACSKNESEDEELLDGEDEEQRKSRDAFLKIALHFLKRRKQEDLVDCLQSRTYDAVCRRKLKSNLKEKYQCVFEGIANAGNPAPLNQIYTELYIAEGETEVNDEHEVRQIEKASWKLHRLETTIKQEDIFKVSPGREVPIRTVMTKGVAGIGKTVLTQKFTLDWAEDKANHDIQFTFPFTFRELNMLKERSFSLVELVHYFFADTKEAGICRFEEFQVLFIFDGLDECRLHLDFNNSEILKDVTKSTSVDVLLTNLIRGTLLPSARVWITTRPAAANQIPSQCVDMVTEVRGFSDPQKEEYFRKRFKDKKQANKIISHVKKSQSLHIMCHIPVFCWITARVLEHEMKIKKRELPKTLTEMYIHFLVVQTKLKSIKYDGETNGSPENSEMIKSLGKLAFEQLQKRNLIFYESDLTECGIDITAASVYSGVFTQVFIEERGLYQDKVFCFVHLSVQEFLAALHVHLTFINSGVNLMSKEKTTTLMLKTRKTKTAESHLYQSALDKALQSPNGHLDLFLRFLLGLSLETNQERMQGLLSHTESSEPTHSEDRSQTRTETIQYIKTKMNDNLSAEKSINLFHCLNELNDCSLVEDIQWSLTYGGLSPEKLSPAQWSALVFILLSSENDLDVFDLKDYSKSENALLRMLPVIKASNKALASYCNLSERGCEALSSALSSPSCRLTELDLSYNDLKDPGIKLLCEALKSQHCRLETLKMTCCKLSEKGCEALSSVLSSQSCSLKVLDISNNDLGDSGVKLLSDGLQTQNCRLETLSLSGCLITEEGCTSLASALRSSCLQELDLSFNYPGETGEALLTAQLEDSDCKLETLRLDHGGPHRMRPGLTKYACELEVDINTVQRNLVLSDNNKTVACVKEIQSYPDHPDRFDVYAQLLCRTGLTDRCYWEVEWNERVSVSLSYNRIGRKGKGDEIEFGGNDHSWRLECCDVRGYSIWHNDKETKISSSFVTKRVAVYVDYLAGTLSFYRVSSDSRGRIHTFNTTFTEPLYPGFRLWVDSTLSLCSP
ncbi:protein NLRC3-like [Xyrichtys novacula]|uniref:Protein NLRC3-like n=1 Tax=Xyrichtys novacula TaxID=13765 RepID=A0AAV1G725_XYRNO|nr:protein NLRC3-like [Xyrichtys novacula]